MMDYEIGPALNSTQVTDDNPGHFLLTQIKVIEPKYMKTNYQKKRSNILETINEKMRLVYV